MVEELPSEILYNIVARACMNYVDEYIGKTSKPDSASDKLSNPITPLLHANRRVRQVTQKVLEDAFDVHTNEDSR